MTFHRLLFVINAMPRKEHNMDVRETTELDEDERIITIADGSDTESSIIKSPKQI